MKIQEFVTVNRITLTSEACDSNPHMEGSADMDNYKVTLRRGPRADAERWLMDQGVHLDAQGIYGW
jgi:hypothetical protein